MFNYQVFLDSPSDFNPTMVAAGCYCACKDKILLVKRQSFKSQGNKWGVPAGKLEKNENPLEAIVREMKEEIGVVLRPEDLEHFGLLNVRLPPIDYIFHMFSTQFLSFPPITLDTAENQQAQWVTLENALELPLMAAGREALLYYKQFLGLK